MSRRFTLFEAKERPFAPAPIVEPACGMDRRQAIALLSAAMAATVSACGKPHEEIVPYVDQPLGLVPGVFQRYATALTLGGYARGVMAVATDGRPIKIEGAPNHPYSLGATDVFAEAEVLSLYDPSRARVVANANGPSSWDGLQDALFSRVFTARKTGGEGVTLLTGRMVSPTELRLLKALQTAFPKLQWRRYEPVNDDAERAGARLAFGRTLSVLPQLAKANVVLSLAADPLGPGPEQIANGRGFVTARRPGAGSFSRLYCAEPGWSLTGANADHRLPAHPAEIRNIALAVAASLGAPTPAPPLSPKAAAFVQACVADLKANAGRALVLAGPGQPPEVHALAHWANRQLRAPVSAIEPLDPNPDDHAASLAAMAADLHAGRVQTLIVMGANPAFDAPRDLGLGRFDIAQAIRKAPFSVHLTQYENETSALCTWRGPLSHALESWGDASAVDGTASLVQPLIRRLHDTRTPAQVLAMLAGQPTPSDYELVRQTWAAQAGPPNVQDQGSSATLTPSGQSAAAPKSSSPTDQVAGDLAPGSLAQLNRATLALAPPQAAVIVGSGTDHIEADQADDARTGAIADKVWKQALSDGLIANTASAPLTPPAPAFHGYAPSPSPRGYELSLTPDPTLYDGRYAENAWLQECPKPITSEVWGASVAISPHDAQALGVKDFDHVRLSRGDQSVQASVRVVAGQADGVISGFVGGGRAQAGPIGTGAGYDFAPLRALGTPWLSDIGVEKAHGHGGPPSFQSLYTLEGDAKKLSPVVAVADLPKLKTHPLDKTETPPTLLFKPPVHEPAWAMVIDQASCIGCNACVVSCQSENNVAVVGPTEIARGRDMHWLRIDTYDTGDAHESRPAFQPVPCMQCEHAPCEPVCPVEASIHDSEGINNQVYNRCIGTRFCQSNCPYKVRRFNWFGYSHDQAYGNLGDDAYDAVKNPEVTVRSRGVMEKCTYCVQRVSAARRTAEKESRDIGAHEVVTACQSACPTQAISFGDKTNLASGMEAMRQDPRHFALLEEEGTRPRTTYLARVRNANPALKPDPSEVSS